MEKVVPCVEGGRFRIRRGDVIGPMFPAQSGHARGVMYCPRTSIYVFTNGKADLLPGNSAYDLVERLDNVSPVREVTRKEIVPGTYGMVKTGRVSVSGETVSISIEERFYTADELLHAAKILMDIAEALQQ